MNELFEKVLKANREYVALVNADSADQVAALEVCKALMDEVIDRGLCTEYREYCESLERNGEELVPCSGNCRICPYLSFEPGFPGEELTCCTAPGREHIISADFDVSAVI